MKSINENLPKVPQKSQKIMAEKKSASPAFRTISTEQELIRSILSLLDQLSTYQDADQRANLRAELQTLITSSQNSYTQLVHTIYSLPERHRAPFLQAVGISAQSVMQYDPAYDITPLEMSAMLPLLKNSDEGVVCRALAIFTLVSHQNQNTLREAGGIAPLIALLTSANSTQQYYALMALAELTNNVENRNAIREAGGITPLIRLLASKDSNTKQVTVLALGYLAANNVDNQNAIRQAGGIVPLVGLLASDDNQMQQYAALALSYLSANNVDNQNAIYEAGGIPLLVGLLTSGDSKTIKYTVLTLNHSINTRSLLYYAQNLTDTQIDAILALSEVLMTYKDAVLVFQESIVIEERIEKKLQQKKYPEQFKNTCQKMILLVKTLHSNNIDQKQMLQEIENLIDSPQNYKQYHALTEQYMKVVDENFLALMILSAALAAKIVSVNYSDNASIKYTSKKSEQIEAAVEQVNTPTRCIII